MLGISGRRGGRDVLDLKHYHPLTCFAFRGFEEDSADDTAFVDDLRDTVSQDEDALFALLSAFSAFTAKKIVSRVYSLLH